MLTALPLRDGRDAELKEVEANTCRLGQLEPVTCLYTHLSESLASTLGTKRGEGGQTCCQTWGGGGGRLSCPLGQSPCAET